MTRILGGLIAAAWTAACLCPAAAQNYPSRPVTLIVSQSAGGLSDVVVRAFATELQRRYGQPFIVDNRPGASAMNAARACSDSKPDGYTICVLSTESLIWNAIMYKALPFDPMADFAPVTNLFTITGVLGANASFGINSLKELIDHSKAHPGKLAYATTSTIATMFMEQFKRDTKADIVGVRFKGGGEAVASVVSGHTQVGLFGLGNFVPHLKSKKVVALAKDGVGRLKSFPDIPDFREAGYDGDRTRSWFGIFMPVGTPEAIITELNKAFAEVGSPPAFQNMHFEMRGLEPAFTTPDGFAKEIVEDRAIAQRLAKAAGVTPQ